MAEVLLQVENLHKSYAIKSLNPFAGKRKIQVLDGMSFNVSAGEVKGVVGKNGAGKTTLLRIVADLLKADSGRVVLGGSREIDRGNIGYVSSDERSFFWRLSGWDNLIFFAKLYGLDGSASRRRVDELLERFGLEKKSRELFGDYSAGTRKKLSLIRAMVHEPGLLIMDELTNSLDEGSVELTKEIVKEYVDGGRAGLWSSHRREEIDELCSDCVEVGDG